MVTSPAPPPRVLIGFTGWLRNGKDSAGAVVIDQHGAHHASFAAKLKEFLYALDPWVRCNTAPGMGAPRVISLARLVDVIGWERAKDEYPDVRPLLQRCGTEAGRKTLWDSVWVDAAMRELPASGVVAFTDCRFPNEADAIKAARGFLVRVTRPGFEPAPDAHESETALDDYPHDFYVTNDGTLEDLQRKVEAVYETCQQLVHGATVDPLLPHPAAD